MADEDAVVEEGLRPAESPLVQVSFQRNVFRKQKYLEAEPKFLGVTQIGMSAYLIINLSVFLASEVTQPEGEVAFFIACLLIVIAGSLAIAAQNLHLPTLRACLGMQIVACGASIFNMIFMLIKNEMQYSCWHYMYENTTMQMEEICHNIETIEYHYSTGGVLVNATLLAISATLAAYCCKVVNCCAPAPKMPVITVEAPPVQQ